MDGLILPAGQDQSVHRLLQILCTAQLHRLCPQLLQPCLMLGKGSLQAKHTDCHLPRSSIISWISSGLMPTMASPRSSDSSASLYGSL